MSTREIKRIVKGNRTVDGAGVQLVRVLGYDDVKEIDPFLMMDAFDSHNPSDYTKGFPMHPHRGIETFTYLVHGEIDHRDTLGNEGRIMGGQAQWMNAGGGILHEEMPVASDWLLGLQLWVNLPAKDKMSTPTYMDIHAENMPRISGEGKEIRVVAGDYEDAEGPHGKYVQPVILDITMQPGAEFSYSSPETDTLFIYVFEGEGSFGEKQGAVSRHSAAIFGEGGQFHGKAKENGIHFMLFSGTPLKEPISWAGPVVMNTREELNQAFKELEEGTFVRS